VSWELASFLVIGAVLIGGFAWYERSRPSSQVVALVAALAALAVAGRVAFAALPNVVATTDIVIFAGFALGAAPGFAVGALAGLVSNFWLGQGPWTPWQMAGWGMCGVLGAVLALARPRAGRLTLATVCALAGIAYGALLNFSLMATYGGDLSLQRFLALESRAVPFDAAHAIGNAGLALVAGPAMVRMLTRFRGRFEWRRPAVASLLVLVVLAGALPARARGADLSATRAAIWLAGQQSSDGGWGASPGDRSSPEVTAWAMLGLEAAGRSPLAVSRGGHDPVDYLRGHVGELKSPGDLARTILALEGARVDPRSFGGRNLVSALLERRRDNGSFEGWPGTTAFAIIALRTADAGGGLERSISWLAKAQNGDGGWGDAPGSPSTADGTGAAMEAMPSSEAAQRGLGYLRKHQRGSGGFALGDNGAVNSQSTAWAVQGMLAVGADPGKAQGGGKSALEYLDARQNSDGHYRYSASSDQTPIWVTAEALTASAGQAFPVTPVAPPATPAPPPSSAAPETNSNAAPSAPAVPPATGTGTPRELLESFGQGGTGGSPPSSGGASGAKPHAASPGAGTSPATPPGAGSEAGDAAPTPPPAAPPFEAGDNPGPSPWAPIGIGLGAAAAALGGVLLLGRRFGW
jgi:energy-coupling factor transport system substrate-specific component